MAKIDPAKVKAVTRFDHNGVFYSLCCDLDMQRAYAGSDDYSIHVFDLQNKDKDKEKKEPVARWTKHDNYISALAFISQPKPLVVSGSFDRQLVWWEPDTGEPVRSVDAHQGWVRDLVATPDGSKLVSVGDDMLVKIWDASSGKLLNALDGHAKRSPQGFVTALYSVAISPDGQFIASGDRIGAVRIWELKTGKLAQQFEVPVLYTYDPRQRKRSIGGIRALAFSPDSKNLAVGGVGQIGNVDGLGGPATVEYWDWRKPSKLFATGADGQSGMINHLAFTPDETWLVAGGTSFVALWKMDKLSDEKEQKGKKDPIPAYKVKANGSIHAFSFNPNGEEFVAAGYQKLEVWKLL